jgi:hypothetical protein
MPNGRWLQRPRHPAPNSGQPPWNLAVVAPMPAPPEDRPETGRRAPASFGRRAPDGGPAGDRRRAPTEDRTEPRSVIAASRSGSSPNFPTHCRNWGILCLMGQMRHKPTGVTCAQARRQHLAGRSLERTGAFAVLGPIGACAVAARGGNVPGTAGHVTGPAAGGHSRNRSAQPADAARDHDRGPAAEFGWNG